MVTLCAVTRRLSSAGAIPARQLSLQPVAIGAAREVTSSPKPSMQRTARREQKRGRSSIRPKYPAERNRPFRNAARLDSSCWMSFSHLWPGRHKQAQCHVFGPGEAVLRKGVAESDYPLQGPLVHFCRMGYRRTRQHEGQLYTARCTLRNGALR